MSPSIAAENVNIAKSQYDTLLGAAFSYTDDKTSKASPIFGTQTTSMTGTLDATQLLPSGTQFRLQLLSDRETTNSAFFTNQKYINQQATLSIKQPLLKNVFGLTNRNTVKGTQYAVETAQAQTQAGLQDLAYANLQTYWNWKLASGVASIEQEALTLARKLYQTNRLKTSIGLAENADLYAYAANIDIRQNELLIAMSNLALAGGELKVALNLADEKIQPGQETLAVSKLPSMDTLTTQALSDNPEASALRAELKTLHVDIITKKNAKLPQVDVSATLAFNGLDATSAAALDNLSNINPLWQSGLNVSFPLQNRQARAELKKAELLRVQKVLLLQNTETRIHALIAATCTRLKQSAQRISVTAMAVQNQRLKWGEEIKKYDQGRSDTDVVIRYQDDYLTAQVLHLKAQIDYQQTLLDLNRLRGALRP